MRQVFFSFFLIVLMSMVGAKAYAYDFAVKNADGVAICYNYINDDKELEVTHFDYYNKYDNYSGKVVIPEEVTYMNRTRKVTSIGNQAFVNCPHITSITLPNSVKSIGEKAFSGFCLKTITLPNSVTTIGNYAFASCLNLISITLSNSLTSIGDHAFDYCKHLTSITLPNSLKSIGDMAFSCCYELASVTIPNSVMTIGEYAFQYCSSLTSITIPNSVTTIGNGAFHNCSGLTSVTIPNSVMTIGKGAFYGCSLTRITIPSSVTTIGEYAFDGWDIPIIISLIENPFAISDDTFSNNTFKNATLYVPTGTIDNYSSTAGWKDFLFIEEGTGGGGTTTQKKMRKTYNQL